MSRRRRKSTINVKGDHQRAASIARPALSPPAATSHLPESRRAARRDASRSIRARVWCASRFPRPGFGWSGRISPASPSARSRCGTRPTRDVIIPATGFNLAGTLTTPPGVGSFGIPPSCWSPAPGPVDRDEVVAGIPIFAQLARGLAGQGFRRASLRQARRRTERRPQRARHAPGLCRRPDRRREMARRSAHGRRPAHGSSSRATAKAARWRCSRRRARSKIASLVLIAAPGTRGPI